MSALPFRPIQDVVVLKVDPVERVLASGLVIPHVNDPERQVADERDIGLVMGAGPGKRITAEMRRPMSVAIGQKVVFGRNKGMLIRYREQDFCILREEHLIGRMNGAGFEPLGGYIVAEQDRGEQETDAGVVIPDVIDRDEATVIMVGPGEIGPNGETEPMRVEPGDRILYNPRMAEPFSQGGRDFIALKQAHIVCVSNR